MVPKGFSFVIFKIESSCKIDSISNVQSYTSTLTSFSITSDETVPSDIEKSVVKVFAYRDF